MAFVTMRSFDNLSAKVQFRNIDLPKNPSDVDQFSDDLNILCELVRDHYLRRLRETLVKNLRDTRCHQNTIHLNNQLEQSVDLCMAEMEKRALRQSMVASVYRKAMSNMINEIKASTNNSMLHDLLKDYIESNNELTLRDENFQSENNENRSVFGNNTEVNLDNTIPKLSGSDSGLFSNFTVNNFTTINNVPSYETLLRHLQDSPNHDHQLPKSEERPDNNLSDHLIIDNDEATTNWVTDVLDELNLPTASPYILTADLPESEIFDDLNSVLKSSFNFPNSASDVGSVEADNTHDSTESSTIYDSPSFDTFLKYVQGSPEHENEFSKLEESLEYLEPEAGSHRPKESTPKLSISVNDINQNVIRINKIDEILKSELKSARVAKTYQLRKSTSKLSLALQTRLNERYSNLFGNDHDDESDPLTEEEEQIVSHRRIVKMVLCFMNPYYVAHRISKRLFKDLARIVSKKLMDQSFDPDKETIERMVKACFVENIHIETAEELHLITTSL